MGSPYLTPSQAKIHGVFAVKGSPRAHMPLITAFRKWWIIHYRNRALQAGANHTTETESEAQPQTPAGPPSAPASPQAIQPISPELTAEFAMDLDPGLEQSAGIPTEDLPPTYTQATRSQTHEHTHHLPMTDSNDNPFYVTVDVNGREWVVIDD